MGVRFSIFDWCDESGEGMAETYEGRLRMVEHADKLGFYCYHLAEHHLTSLSQTPSPSVLLSAVAQRTKRLRLGALTFLLPHYNPLRLLEEMCMLDQLSFGRLEVGLSRGSSGEEGRGFGFGVEDARPMFNEALEVILHGLTTGELNYHGKYFQFEGLKTRLRPYQKPYPPLWYPTSNAESVPWLASQGFSTIFGVNQHPKFERLVQWMDTYRTEYEAHRDDPDRPNAHVKEPNYGFQIHTHVAETDEQARRQMREAWAVWVDNFRYRFIERGQTEKYIELEDFDRLVDEGKVLVGSPATVRELLGRYLTESGANYFLGSFAFGSMPVEQVLQSVDLFAREVMPALAEAKNSEFRIQNSELGIGAKP